MRLKYITLPRPNFDRERERDRGEGKEENLDEAAFLADIVKYLQKPADQFPKYKWVVCTIATVLWNNANIAWTKCSSEALGHAHQCKVRLGEVRTVNDRADSRTNHREHASRMERRVFEEERQERCSSCGSIWKPLLSGLTPHA